MYEITNLTFDDLFEPSKFWIFVPYLTGEFRFLSFTDGKLWATFVRQISIFIGLRWKTIGHENIDPKQTYIVVCNHQTALDVLAIGHISIMNFPISRYQRKIVTLILWFFDKRWIGDGNIPHLNEKENKTLLLRTFNLFLILRTHMNCAQGKIFFRATWAFLTSKLSKMASFLTTKNQKTNINFLHQFF